MRIRAVTDGDLAVDHYWTTFLRGTVLGESAGPDTPDHQLTDGHRERSRRRVTVAVPEDVTWRYADASGDHSTFHTDAKAAAAAGFPTIILHGMCTFGMTVAALKPDSRRVAVRFAGPTYPGQPLLVDAYDAGAGRLAFEAYSEGSLVLTNGRLEG
jgi:hypothetical protein